MMTDPIADMLTRIRNGGRARLLRVSIPGSRLKTEIARVLKERGFIADFAEEGEPKKQSLSVQIRYTDYNTPIIEGIERVSRPSRRIYVACRDIPQVRNGLGLAILSTPRGILTDDQAREAGVGGEILARVW